MANSYLDFQSAKVDYRSLLTPPDGYTIDYAVGTTYSLDLQALLTVPLAFGAISDLGDDIQNINKLYILSAISETKKKFAIFCNNSNIKAPIEKQDSIFHALLDDCVFTVAKEKCASFHPKVWIISFRGKDLHIPNIIRIGVLSRNLTFSNDFDIATYVDGAIETKASSVNKYGAIGQFLSFLLENNPSAYHKQKIRELQKNVARVKEFKCSPLFSNVNFHFFNGGYNHPFDPSALCKDVTGLAVVSPFLSSRVVNDAFALSYRKENDFKRLLVTKQFQYLSQIKGFCEGEVRGFQGDNNDPNRDIHAKIIFQERKKASNRLFVGSLNLTANAFYKNAEFVAEFEFSKGLKHVSFDDFYGMFNSGLFQNIEPVKKQENTDDVVSFDEFFDHFSKGSVKKKYIHLKFNCDLPSFEIRMYGSKKNKFEDVTKDIFLEYHSIKEICEFFVIRKSGKEIVVKIPLEQKPEKRDEELKNSLFETRGDMIEYLMLLLPGANVVTGPGRGKGKNKGSKIKNIFNDNLYEKMLKMMGNEDCKDRLKDLKNTLEKLSKKDFGKDEVNSLKKLSEMIDMFSDAAKTFYRH